MVTSEKTRNEYRLFLSKNVTNEKTDRSSFRSFYCVNVWKLL